MRITICCKRFGRRAGAEAFLTGFAQHLLKGGHHVKVIARDADHGAEGIEIVRLPVLAVPRAFRDLALARAAGRALANEEADVTFSDQKCWGAQGVRPGGGVQREHAKQRQKSYRTPVRRALNRALRAVSVRERLGYYIEDKLYEEPGPRCVIANSDMVRRELVRHFPHLAERIRVVYNGADPTRFTPELKAKHRGPVRDALGIPREALVGIFVGHDWRRKGLYTFIEALGILARKSTPRPVYGVVVGRGGQRRAEVLARRRGAAEVVRFAGPAEPDRYYGASDVLVLPSYYDACANVTLEGLACGLPAITSVYNGAHELLTPGTNGFYVSDASDADQLAEFIEYFLDEERLAAASESARGLALERTQDRMYREIVEAITSAIGAEPPRPT